MRHFLGRIVSNKRSILRAVAVATAAGSALVYPEVVNSNASGTIALSLPVTADDLLPAPWQIPLFSQGAVMSAVGRDPPHFSRVAPSPDAGVNGDDGHRESKNSSPCLGRDSIRNAAAKVGPSVVNISALQGFHGLTSGKSIGSGTIIDPDGTILTCAHAVVDFRGTRVLNKGKVEVTLQDGRTFQGTVLNADMHSDIAVVKIKSKLPLPAAKLGASAELHPGDWVIAMGCPLSLQNTVTAGIIRTKVTVLSDMEGATVIINSCVDRKSSDLGLGGMSREYLQTDCAINSGNSGGPLVSIDGEVVGVNIMKVAAADGLSFAVPIDSVTKILEHFKRNGRVVRPWLGLKMIDLNELIISQLKERDPHFPDVDRGVLVPMVTPGSPADHAGFRPGDVVIDFDGKPVSSIKEIIDIMGDKVGTPLKVTVKRSKNIVAKLTVAPEEANPDI